MNIEYDQQADALYLNLLNKKQKISMSKEVAPGIILDLDKKGKPLGLEIIAVSEKLRPADLFNFSVRPLAQENT